LVAEEVLEDSSVASQSPGLNPKDNLWRPLKMAVAARKPKNITELEDIAHKEWVKRVKGCSTKY